MSITITESSLLSVRRDKQVGSSFTAGGGGGGGSTSAGGVGGITSHSALSQLDYALAGHTGFAPIASPTFTGIVTMPILKVTTGAAAGNMLISDATGILGYLAAGATTTILVGGGAANPVWTDATGTGAPVRAESPTFTGKVTVSGSNEVISYFQTSGGYAALSFSGTGGTDKGALTTYDGKVYIGRMNAAGTGAEIDIIIDSFGNVNIGTAIKSDTYASQTTGWKITQEGAGDFRYLYTDELHAKAFIADLEQALAGGQIISKSVAPLAAVFTVPAAGANATLVVESFKGFNTARVFVDADIIRLRQFAREGGGLQITDCWGTVVWASTDETNKTQTYTFIRSAAPNAGAATAATTIGKGTLALDYGTTGNGFLESNAIDGAMAVNSPYHQIVSWTTHPATGQVVKTRLGNLAGLAGYDIVPASPGYGLYSQNVYLSGKIVATSGYIGGATGWAITAGSLIAGSGATRIELDTTAGIHMGATLFASAPFSVTPAGALKATGITELGTATANYGGGFNWNIAIKGADIYEPSYANHGGCVYINRIGFNGGTTYFRNTVISNGKATGLFFSSNGYDNTLALGYAGTVINIDGGTLNIGSNISSSGFTNLNGCHIVIVGNSNDTCAVAESDLTGFTVSVTPKANKLHISFSIPIYVTAVNQEVSVIINVGGNNVDSYLYFIPTMYTLVNGSAIVSVTPKSAITVKLRWSGTTSSQYLGFSKLYGAGRMIVTDLF